MHCPPQASAWQVSASLTTCNTVGVGASSKPRPLRNLTLSVESAENEALIFNLSMTTQRSLALTLANGWRSGSKLWS